MEMVRLKNGAEEGKPLVLATMMSLRRTMEKDPMAFYDFVMLCRDRHYEPFGNAIERLENLSLVHSGQVHESIRNVVLSAVEGDGLEMTIGSPVAE